jgi:hypothetical protein
MAMSPQSFPPSSPSSSNQLQQKVNTGILWVFGAAILLGLPSSQLLNPEISIGLLFAIGMQNAINIAIERAIIQSSRNDQDFLDTAWVLQIVCGVVFCLFQCIVASFIALFYKQSILDWLPMLAVACFATIVTSLNSTNLASAERKLAWGKVFRVRILAVWLGKGANLIFLLFLISYLPRSQLQLWTLIIGGAVTAVPLCVLSHILLEGKFNRFQWDWAAFQSLCRYGVWIVGICVLESLMYNFELLASENFLNLASFTVYDYLSKAAPFFMGFSLVPSLRKWVLFPVYSELVRTHSSKLYLFLRKSRLIILCFVSILALLFILWEKPVISMLFYNSNRLEPFLGLFPLLAVQGIVSTIGSTYDDVLYAQGKTSTLFFLTMIQVVLEAALFFLGMRSFGLQGILLGIIISSYLIYAVKAFYFARQSLWQPVVDFPFLAIASILLIALLAQNRGLPMM